VLDISEMILNSITDGNCVILVFLDFANAFPSVNHNILKEILVSIGTNDLTMKWFSSFLNGWSQSVNWNSQFSENEQINIGVFQGEGNSQLLFSLYINQLVTYIKHCILRQFADDTCISITCKVNENDIERAIQLINEDLQNVSKFSDAFKIKINPIKSSALIISSKYNRNKINYEKLSPIIINNEIIKYSENVKYLGYHIDREFSPTTHVNSIAKKINYVMSQLYAIKHSVPIQIKLNIFKSLVLPNFDYLDVIYHEYNSHGSGINEKQLQKLFNCGIRFIYNLNYDEHVTPYIIQSNLLPLKERREIHIALMSYKIINNLTPSYLNNLLSINENNLRSNKKLLVQKPRNNLHKKSFAISVPQIWNRISEETRNLKSLQIFKNDLEKSYLEKHTM
jgi:hypothetical protein